MDPRGIDVEEDGNDVRHHTAVAEAHDVNAYDDDGSESSSSDAENERSLQQFSRGLTSSSPASSSTGGGGASSAAVAVRYDVHDNTIAAVTPSKGKRRVWVLPRALLPVNVTAASPSRASVAASSSRTSTQSTAAGGGGSGSCAGAEGNLQPDALQHHGESEMSAMSAQRVSRESCGGAGGGGCGGGGSFFSSFSSSSSPHLAVEVVRLPHPRHGEPTLFLLHPHASPAAASPSSLLFEIQAQAPPNDMAQSWFVGEEVVPSSPHSGELLAVTPVDLTFFALSELFGTAATYERLSKTFMSASDLYRSGGVGAPPLPQQQAVPSATAASPAQLDACVSVFSGIGGGGAEAEEEESSNSDPFAYSFGQTPSMTDQRRSSGDALPARGTTQPLFSPSASLHDKGWAGWAHAAAHDPLRFQRCLDALQDDALLRRFCEVRVVGSDSEQDDSRPDVYYRLSDAVAVEWLRRKVLQVRASAVLRAILQLPERARPAEPTTSTTSAVEAEEVPMSMAFGVVAEYVPQRLHAALSAACGLQSSASAATATGGGGEAVSPAFNAGAKRDRAGEGIGSGASAAAAAAVAVAPAGPKSASVKRLEKAGRPKGTPTLFSMFASKKKEGS